MVTWHAFGAIGGGGLVWLAGMFGQDTRLGWKGLLMVGAGVAGIVLLLTGVIP